ncbi:ferrochelatase [Betaproteobacteria bacterium]|nr:ferrochelatase [Betaproteobacteria bacterium]GHT99785.1 ferrochelatase [Betaproteobacteria bacterium]GHU21330.1 ferrochelatase [Betaproteobacteria bacterium]
MPRFLPEPLHTANARAHTGILLVNLGSPATPTSPALRTFLRQFLSDPRVIELPKLVWWPILHGAILTTRPAKSARKYASIWTDKGAPLKEHTAWQATAVDAVLDDPLLTVAWAMRYGTPDIATVLNALRTRCGRILIVPLYPQFSASTSASTMDEVARAMLRWRNQPELRFVRSFGADPGYINALAKHVREHWEAHGQGECLVMSFHGLPRRMVELGDPYQAECLETAHLLQQALALPDDKVRITFQSRFGRAAWLQPYTQPTIEALASSGIKQIDVICPGFVADCLETLEEIALLCRDAFLTRGGKAFHYIPCLNDDPDWISALAALIHQHLGGWLPPAQEGRFQFRNSVDLSR